MKKRKKLRSQSSKDAEKFWHYVPSHLLAKARFGEEAVPSADGFYRLNEQTAVRHSDTALLVKTSMERCWMRSGYPFFRVWPKLTPYLLKLNDAKITGDLIQLPYPVFGVFFHAGDRAVPSVPAYPVRSLLFGWPKHLQCPPHLLEKLGGDGLLLVADLGERIGGNPVVSWFNMPLPAGKSVFEIVESLSDAVLPSARQGILVPIATVRAMIRIGLALCFMSRGEEDSVITPYVERPAEWSTGRGKPKLLREAKIRPDAFDVGKTFTVQPHWRSPSPLALYWTGKGRKIPRLRYRRGCAVHRKKVQVEYDGDDGPPSD